MRRAAGAGGLVAAGLAAIAAPVAQAQPLSGTVFNLSLSQRFEADTNYRLDADSAGTSYFTETRVTLGLLSETPTQSFSLDVDTGLRALAEADEDFDLTYADPVTTRARYNREWSNAALGVLLGYRRSERSVLAVAEDDFDFITPLPDDLEQFDGTENRYNVALDLALATNAPSSYSFGFAATRFDYADVPSGGENAVPRTILSGDATWSLRLNPVLSSAVRAAYELYDAEDDTETQIRTATLDAGLVYDASDVMRLSGGLGYSDRTREETIFGLTISERDWGPSLRGGVRYTLPYLVVDANARVTTAAPETRSSGEVVARYDLARGQLRARAFQSYGGNNDGDEVLLRGLGLGVTREINSLSRVEFDLAMASETNKDTADEEDSNRLDATLAMSYDLTAEVSTRIGYRLQLRDENPGESAQSNAVFFTIGRTFSGRY